MSKKEFKVLHNIHKQKDLVIQKSDKGNTVVITEKNTDFNKTNEIISYANKFEQINTEEKKLNFMFKSEKKAIDLIKRLENEEKRISFRKEYELIYPRGSRPGILF